MSEIRREETTVVNATPTATEADRFEDVVYDPYTARRNAVYKAQEVIYLLLVVLEGLLVIRFALRLFAANPAAGFAQFIYGLTAPFVVPFLGLFPTPAARGSVLELYTLVALIVYPLVFWVVVRLIWLLFGDTRTGVVTRRVDTHRVEPRR
jgi:hypothetical protein